MKSNGTEHFFLFRSIPGSSYSPSHAKNQMHSTLFTLYTWLLYSQVTQEKIFPWSFHLRGHMTNIEHFWSHVMNITHFSSHTTNAATACFVFIWATSSVAFVDASGMVGDVKRLCLPHFNNYLSVSDDLLPSLNSP